MAIDRITTGAVLDGAIQTADIANLAVDDTKLAANSVTKEKIAPGAAFVTGMIMPYAGAIANQAAAPSGWLLCDGSEQSATTYVDLKNLLLTTYGPYSNGSGGTGTTHFRVPDLRGRVIAALNNMGGGDGTGGSRVTSPEGDQLGGILGAEEHELTGAQSGIAQHFHGGVVSSVTGNQGGARYAESGNVGNTFPLVSVSVTSGANTNNVSATNAAEAHPSLQPTMFMNYIIKT